MSGPPRRRIAVVFGGRSAEHEVSVTSARSILAALDPERYDVLTVGIDRDGRWHALAALPAVTVDEGPSVALSREPGDAAIVTDDGRRLEIDVVFPILHGPFGEDGTIQGLLELAGIPYVGAGVLASALGMDKAAQKTLFEAAGLGVVPHQVVYERDWERDRAGVLAHADALGLPVFTKPAALGSSIGITKVKRAEDLPASLEVALAHSGKALIERSMEGARELECAVLGNDEPLSSIPGEIVPDAEWYDYRAKYVEEGTRLDVPARVPAAIAEEVRRMAIVAFQAIDGAGMARVDFFYREPDELMVNEINTIPGFTPISMYPKLWEATGLPYDELITRLIELAVERHERERKRGGALPS